MDFMDFEVYYYLSEEDKQSYLNSIGFNRVDYLISYNTWFSNPNNPITNSVTKTINIRACSNGNLINNSFYYLHAEDKVGLENFFDIRLKIFKY